jgi:putative ABC transport system substrate-binding protein
MHRRDFMAFLGAATAWPFAARAQQPSSRMRRLGVLVGIQNDTEGQIRVKALEQSLRELGWVEGVNIQTEYRWAAADPERLRAYSAELVKLAPDVILGSSTPVAAVLRRVTQSIPVVFVVVTDPVGNGLVNNLARPGGNITGFTNFEISMGGKWLEILRDIAPGSRRIGLMFNPANSPSVRSYYSPSIEAAAHSFRVKVVDVPFHDAAEIDRAVDAFARDPDGGLVVLPDNTTVRHRERIVAAANKHRLPAVYPYRYFATSGGLLSYGIDTVDLYRRGASYVDRILRGEKPGDLPVQQPTKFELVINLTAAKALGLSVPRSMLASANEVIE